MDKEQRAAIDELMMLKAEALALDLLEAVASGERERNLDAEVSWQLYVQLAERGPRHCLNN